MNISPHVRESMTVLNSWFHTLDSGLEVLDSAGFLSLLGFKIPWAVFLIPKPMIPDSTEKNAGFCISLAKDSRIQIPF